MPIKIPAELPAYNVLSNENIFVIIYVNKITNLIQRSVVATVIYFI